MARGSLGVSRSSTTFRYTPFRRLRPTHGYTKYFVPKIYNFVAKFFA
ncbi:MAG: hypothetical protein PHE25_02225 [Candidatus Gracilibacteria bacterium]|nr:hypothetical protein [Candidatus Gracilibacteria bacterium]